MDYDQEIHALAAETLAIQTILAHVFDQIIRLDARFGPAIKQGFDNAASDVEDLAIRLEKAASPHALRIVENLRAATLGKPDKPSHGV
jgi:hypothetical protein